MTPPLPPHADPPQPKDPSAPDVVPLGKLPGVRRVRIPRKPTEEATLRRTVLKPLVSTAGLIEEVVVPVEGSEEELLAQQEAVHLAAALAVPLRALHVNGVKVRISPDLFDYLRVECNRWGVDFRSVLLEGSDVVSELVKELGPRSIVVIGSRRLVTHYHVGSVAAELVRRAPCAIMIVRIG